MAVDIVKAHASTTTVNNGSVVIATGGKGLNGRQIKSDRAITYPTIATLSGQYEGDFSQVRYYTGDTSS